MPGVAEPLSLWKRVRRTPGMGRPQLPRPVHGRMFATSIIVAWGEVLKHIAPMGAQQNLMLQS